MKFINLAAAAVALASCSAADSALNHSTLNVQTHMSETIFLTPVAPSRKTIYIAQRNTSDHPEVDLKTQLTQAVRARGYTVVEDPASAQFWLRANILEFGEVDQQAAGGIMSSGYGQPLLGAGAGALAAGVLTGGNVGATVGAGVLGGLATAAANMGWHDVIIAAVVDVQIGERLAGNYRSWNARVSATADQQNLRLETAVPTLEARLSSSLANLFE